jgi:hypothetical protein
VFVHTNIAGKVSGMRDHQSGIHDGSSCSVCSGEEGMIAAEMQALVHGAAVPVMPGDTVKAQQRRAWEALGRPTWWRLRAAWYGEAECWSAAAVEDMRRRERARREREANARDQARELGSVYAGIVDRMLADGANVDSPEVARLLDAARALGHLDRSVDRPRGE